jgi:hypothetical protein
MKKNLLILTMAAFAPFLSNSVKSQEMVKNGDFEVQGAWQVNDAGDASTAKITSTFGTDNGRPTNGSGYSYEASYTYTTTGSSQIFVYQPVVVTGGHSYKVDALFKDNSELLSNFWVELTYITYDPKDSTGDLKNNVKTLEINTWDGCGPGADGLVSVIGCSKTDKIGIFKVPDSLDNKTLYFGFTIGTWSDADRSFDVSLDNYTLTDLGASAIKTIGIAKQEISNYPNPVNNITTITYNVPSTGNVNVSVYNMVGEEVAGLVNCIKSAGTHTVEFDASSLSSGVYFCKLQTNGSIYTSKMLLVK